MAPEYNWWNENGLFGYNSSNNSGILPGVQTLSDNFVQNWYKEMFPSDTWRFNINTHRYEPIDPYVSYSNSSGIDTAKPDNILEGLYGKYAPYVTAGKLGLDLANMGQTIYSMFKARERDKLARKAFNYTVDMNNRGLYNQAKSINNILDAGASTAAANRTAVNNGQIVRTPTSIKNDFLDRAKTRYMDGSPINAHV